MNLTEELIPDGEIRILNEGMAYCMKCYEDDIKSDLYEESNLMAKKYIDYMNAINPKHLEDEVMYRALSAFFPPTYETDRMPQLTFRPTYYRGKVKQKAHLCMKFYRLENDESFFDRPKTYAGVIPDHPTSNRTTHGSD